MEYSENEKLREYFEDVKSIEVEAENETGAISVAQAKLEVLPEEIDYEVINEGSRGILSLVGSSKRTYKVSIKDPDMYRARKLMIMVLNYMGLPSQVECERTDEGVYIHVKSKYQGLLIGKRGQTLDALHFILNRLFSGNGEDHTPVIVDVANYRRRRERSLSRLAQNVAKKVKMTKIPQLLEPMGPAERKIVHFALKDEPSIFTRSIGSGIHKRMKIMIRDEIEGEDY
ncbi:MAG: RNA-binding cell elongation regulator Jag/EloR [bacterium]